MTEKIGIGNKLECGNWENLLNEMRKEEVIPEEVMEVLMTCREKCGACLCTGDAAQHVKFEKLEGAMKGQKLLDYVFEQFPEEKNKPRKKC